MNRIDLGASRSPELSGRSAPWCLLVPLGATEQHGPHLPVNTDTIIASEWAAAAATRTDGVVVAPALPFGSSGEHRDFPGTISIGRSALTTVVIEIARSVAPSFHTVVFVSGHGGNVPVLEPAVDVLRPEGHRVDWTAPHWPAPLAQRLCIDGHAGRTETSLMLHLRPDLVLRFDDVTGNTTPVDELMPVMAVSGLAAVTSNGVLGDPRSASAEEGRRLFSHLVDGLVERINGLAAAVSATTTDPDEAPS